MHFAREPGSPWDPKLPGNFYQKIAEQYPGMEPHFGLGMQIEIRGAGDLSQQFLPPTMRFRFTHTSQNSLLQLSQDILSLNVLRPYPGWASMKDAALWAWDRCLEAIAPRTIKRVGLRYANRIVRTKAGETAATWLKPSKYLCEAALHSLPGFLSRVEASLDPEHRVVVTLGEAVVPEGDVAQPFGSIIFDVDRIALHGIPATGDALATAIEDLHNGAWAVFSETVGPRLEAVMRGR